MVLFSQRAKLSRARDVWRERGPGDARLLFRRTTGKARVMLRHEDTGQIVGKFNIVDDAFYCQLKPYHDSGKGF